VNRVAVIAFGGWLDTSFIVATVADARRRTL
jgi:hypothetical protein